MIENEGSVLFTQSVILFLKYPLRSLRYANDCLMLGFV